MWFFYFGSLCLVWLPVQGHEKELGNGGIKLETTLKEILIQKADICTVFGFVEFLKIKKKSIKISIHTIFLPLWGKKNILLLELSGFVLCSKVWRLSQCSLLVFPVLLSRNSASRTGKTFPIANLDNQSNKILKYGFHNKSFILNAPLVSCPIPVIRFGWVQQQTHPKRMTGIGQLTRGALLE